MLDDKDIIEKINSATPDIPEGLKPDSIREILERQPVKFRYKDSRSLMLKISAGVTSVAAAAVILLMVFSGGSRGQAVNQVGQSKVFQYNNVYSALADRSTSIKDGFQVNETAAGIENTESNLNQDASGKGSDYSSGTNNQVNGVDEINSLQTDGNYIYAVDVDDSCIRVYKAMNGATSLVNSVKIQLDAYVVPSETSSGNISQDQGVGGSTGSVGTASKDSVGNSSTDSVAPDYPESQTAGSGEIASGDSGGGVAEGAPPDGFIDEIPQYLSQGIKGIYLLKDLSQLAVVYMDYSGSAMVTSVAFYDVSDTGNIRLLRENVQSGYYQGSRLTGNELYLFTTFSPSFPSDPELYQSYIPSVNGVLVDSKDFLIPDKVTDTQQTVIAAYNTEKADDIHSYVLMGYSGDYYVTGQGIYAYSYNFNSGEKMGSKQVIESSTGIQRIVFDRNKGFLADKKAVIPGTVDSRYSIHEKDGYLVVVTTKDQTTVDQNQGSSTTADRTSGIYILDEDMKLYGSLDGMAKGEQVYSAEFVGDYAYFVTFKSMDPLFAIDLRDMKHPKMVSELKVSGYSDYMKSWSEGKMLGIGIEADDSGKTLGAKLSMFDVTDPTHVTVESSLSVVPELGVSYVYLPWSKDASKIIADPVKNLIGFNFESEILTGSMYGYKNQYVVYSYENATFREVGSFENHSYLDLNAVYIGSYIYVFDAACNQNGIIPIK